jgi:hypothetical protein
MIPSLFSTITRSIPQGTSLNEAIASALDISYDAAHRRTSGKCKLSLDEALKLAAHFNCSLDALQEVETKNIVAVQKTAIIESAQDLENYFRQSTASIKELSKVEGVHMYYSAKDIPIFHTLDGTVLTRFKIYVWLRLLSPDFENTSFHTFNLPLSTLEAAKELGLLYKSIPKTEIWDTTTFNSTLKQIHFYFQAGLLEGALAKVLCGELSALMAKTRSNLKSTTENYNIYHNELLLMNNTVLITSPYQKAFYVPFTFLSYFLATDKRTCDQAESYIQKQLKNSKLLNTAGEASRNLFFNKISKRIDALETLVAAQEIVDFE